MKLVEIFSKAARDERRQRINEDIRRGYFAEFKVMQQTKGRVLPPCTSLLPAQTARAFPRMECVEAHGDAATFPEPLPPRDQHKLRATLVTVASRASAQPYLEAWTKPFTSTLGRHDDLGMVEITIVDSAIMRLWPMKNLLLYSGRSALLRRGEYDPPTRLLFHFGDAVAPKRELGMVNGLTGYVFLLDSSARVRWWGSGEPRPEEIEALLSSAKTLLQAQ
ncbi:hypothetical protein H632_c1102p1 [Helicosporidium sp. ATCC 50920]|nr:hypothetical protein H632_c1102p1 [Helicosporidium sp. ATCC 50920]|eukprot:KDD74741.1 hypothetical protein H632_c1102p1 [Helicosporidium sp. ATCC 50920]